MFAVVRIKGKQFRVKENSVIKAPYMEELQPGQHIILDEVLLLEQEDKIEVGTPVVEGTNLEAEVMKQTKGKKLIVFRKRRRTGFKKKTGARAKFTELRVLGIAKDKQ